MTTLSDVVAALNDSEAQATALLASCTSIKDGVAADIAAAVVTSVNAAQIPLVSMATDLVNVNALLVQLLNGT
jgi:hypothetical protein